MVTNAYDKTFYLFVGVRTGGISLQAVIYKLVEVYFTFLVGGAKQTKLRWLQKSSRGKKRNEKNNQHIENQNKETKRPAESQGNGDNKSYT